MTGSQNLKRLISFSRAPGSDRTICGLEVLQPERGICSHAEVDRKSEASVVTLVQLTEMKDPSGA